MSLIAGSKLGPYEILAPIGAGGMGTVYRARDTRLGREVAIKVSPEHFSDRFEREAHAIAALNHPNICTLHDVGPNYLVMELVEGPTLGERIKQGEVPIEEALRIARQIAEALEAAHEKGIVHRDLKPGNIKVTPDGMVKVLDFGLAKLSEPVSEGSPDESPTLTLAHATQTGAIMGTAAYMAPEQARGAAVDKRADIWAFGVVLYEMLSGKRLFKGETISDTLASVLARDPDWTALPAPTPRRVRTLLERCLERDRKQRLQAIGEARIAIDSREPEIAPVAGRQARPSRGRWWWLAAAAAFAAIVFLAGWRFRGPPAAPPVWKLSRLTTDTGLSDAAALSPDGKLVAYSSDRGLNGERDLYIKQTAGGQAIRLTADGAGNTTPNFSPDGAKIVFRSNRDGGGIYEIPAFGGDARLLARDGLDPKFSPDGSEVAYWIGAPGIDARVPGSGAVWLISLAGGAPQRVGPSFTAARHPVWAPDGKHLLLVGYTSPKAYQDSGFDWWSVAVNGGEAVRTGVREALVVAGLQIRDAATASALSGVARPACWVAATGVVFSATNGDAMNLWELPLSPTTGKVSGSLKRLTTGTGNETDPNCTAGGKVAFTSGETRRDLWSLPVDLDRGAARGMLERITQGPVTHEHASLSRDARRIAFASDQSGRQNIWIRDLASGKEFNLTSSTFVERFPVINPSGTRVAYSVYEGDKRVVAVAAPGGAPEKLCEACLRATDWSSDEKTLLVFGGDPYRVDLLDVASHRQTPLLKHPTYNLLYGKFSPDNRRVSFTVRTEPNRAYIAIAPLDGPKPVPESAWTRITDSAPEDWANWSPDGKTLYFTSNRDGHSCLWGQHLEAGSLRPVGAPFAVQHFHGRVSYRQGGWSAAGNRIGLVLAEDTGNIWMMSPTGGR